MKMIESASYCHVREKGNLLDRG